jgi:hypothetical protein
MEKSLSAIVAWRSGGTTRVPEQSFPMWLELAVLEAVIPATRCALRVLCCVDILSAFPSHRVARRSVLDHF